MGRWQVNATETIATLPRDAARMLAVEILLAEPESLGDDVLESCLYLFRERLRAALGPESSSGWDPQTARKVEAIAPGALTTAVTGVP
jgi:hypothetical protein